MENKSIICQLLLSAVRETRAGQNIESLIFDPDTETVTIYYDNGYKNIVNVCADSGIAMMRDVLKQIN